MDLLTAVGMPILRLYYGILTKGCFAHPEFGQKVMHPKCKSSQKPKIAIECKA
jgi:hypothetical protein